MISTCNFLSTLFFGLEARNKKFGIPMSFIDLPPETTAGTPNSDTNSTTNSSDAAKTTPTATTTETKPKKEKGSSSESESEAESEESGSGDDVPYSFSTLPAIPSHVIPFLESEDGVEFYDKKKVHNRDMKKFWKTLKKYSKHFA
jgi:hypothetical protein